jgi:hypothetical protein
MKKPPVFFAGIVLFFTMIAVMSYKPLPPGPSANGQGALENPWFNGRVQHFSFHANTDADGLVTGTFETKSPGQEIRTHGTINCLTVLPDGKTAIMSGVVTQKVGDGFPGYAEVGSTVWFKVVDNGEGAKSDLDQFSDYTEGPGDCSVNQLVRLYQIVNGNIQVKQ